MLLLGPSKRPSKAKMETMRCLLMMISSDESTGTGRFMASPSRTVIPEGGDPRRARATTARYIFFSDGNVPGIGRRVTTGSSNFVRMSSSLLAALAPLTFPDCKSEITASKSDEYTVEKTDRLTSLASIVQDDSVEGVLPFDDARTSPCFLASMLELLDDLAFPIDDEEDFTRLSAAFCASSFRVRDIYRYQTRTAVIK